MYEIYISAGVIGFFTFSFYFYSIRKKQEKYEQLEDDFEVISLTSDEIDLVEQEKLEKLLITSSNSPK